jgi:60kDa lysophospholipase
LEVQPSTLSCVFAQTGDLEQLRNLINNPNVSILLLRDYDLRTPLHIACTKGNLEISAFLLKNGFDPNAVDRWGRTPFVEALANNNHQLVKLLVLHHAVLPLNHFWTLTDLFLCVLSNDLWFLDQMLENGPLEYVNILTDYDGRTLLHISCAYSSLSTVRLLIAKGAMPTIKDRWVDTAYDIVKKRGNPEIISLFGNIILKDKKE